MFRGGGGANMREAQIYNNKHLKREKITLCWGGESSLNWVGIYPP